MDLSTDRYMPGRFGLFFQINSIQTDRVEFSFMAEDYHIDLTPQDSVRDVLEELRKLLPVSARVKAAIAAQGFDHVLGVIEGEQETEPVF